MTLSNKEAQEIRRENAARELRYTLEEYECALRRTVADDGIEASLSLKGSTRCAY